MLTISQLAAHAGVTVRAVRHYHEVGLLAEPARDRSGYRSYDVAAVVRLIRIHVLADAGVPLARVQELLDADPARFADGVGEIDAQLRAEIRRLRTTRTRLARLAAGEHLALPASVVGYLDRIRDLGVDERYIELERDAWIMLAAQVPDRIEDIMVKKHRDLDDPDMTKLYSLLGTALDWPVDDPRVLEVADIMERLWTRAADTGEAGSDGLDDRLVELLDAVLLEYGGPIAERLLAILEQRGFTGWTRVERTPPKGDTPMTSENETSTGSPWTGTVPVDDTTLAVTDTGGPGVPIVYLNGQFATQGYWRRVIADLGPGYRHITYDERARGRRSGTSSDYSFEAAVRDVDAVLAARGVNRVLVVGWSYGAFVGAHWVSRHPDRAVGAVLVDGAQPSDWIDELTHDQVRTMFRRMSPLVALARPTGLTPRMTADQMADSNIELGERARQRELGPVLDAITVPVRYVLASGSSFGSKGDQQERIRADLDPVFARKPNITLGAKVASNHGAILRKDFRAVADAVRRLAAATST